MKLPWKVEALGKLPSNYQLCKKRLGHLVRRLRRTGRLEEYNDMLQKQIKAEFIEIVKNTEPRQQIHYLPHLAVFKSESTTTKLRIVYDASAKANRGSACLNDMLEVKWCHP